MQDIQQIKHTYKQFKNILDIISDGDRKDDLAQDLRRGLDVQQVMEMKQFTLYCEDIGIPLLLRSVN